jgi:DNA-binding GntR family transcriptional regulator
LTVLQPLNNRPESLTERVYEAIREAIVARTFAPGARITEKMLADQLCVSKTPVREALLRLSYVGLIETDGIRGGRIVMPSREAIQSAYELRAGIEAQSARVAAERGSPTVLREVREYAETALARAKDGDGDGFRAYDRRFHLRLGESTDNGLISRFVGDAFDITWALRRRDVLVASDWLICAKQHIAVMDAIEKGDAGQADTAMREHISKIEAMVLATFDTEALRDTV